MVNDQKLQPYHPRVRPFHTTPAPLRSLGLSVLAFQRLLTRLDPWGEQPNISTLRQAFTGGRVTTSATVIRVVVILLEMLPAKKRAALIAQLNEPEADG